MECNEDSHKRNSQLPAPSMEISNDQAKGKSMESPGNLSLRVRKNRVHIRQNKSSVETGGNLPKIYQIRDLSQYQFEGKATLVSSKELTQPFTELRAGDIVHVLIEQSITASPSVPSPIRAEILDSHARGSVLIGEARLDSELKRILIQFKKLRDIQSETLYQISADALSTSGEIGLNGEYHSQDGKFFIAELFSAGLAGFADSTIARTQSLNGVFVEKPGLDTAAKKGIVSALSQTSQRMAEREKNAPEYTHVDGYQIIPVIISDQPKRQGL